MEPVFEKTYGPHGDWVTLFKTGEGFLRTELVRGTANPQQYLTLDHWSSEEAYENFRLNNAAQYKSVDARCEALTESETEIGRFKKLA